MTEIDTPPDASYNKIVGKFNKLLIKLIILEHKLFKIKKKTESETK